MNPEPQVGDIVNITIKGARVIDTNTPLAKKHGPAIRVALPGKDGEEAKGAVWTELPAITITVTKPAAPAEWPPRLGDLWRDTDGDLWFATDMNAADDPTGPCIEFVSTRLGDHEDPDDARRQWGPLTLVHRDDTADSSARDHAMDAYGWEYTPEPAPARHPAWPPRQGDLWSDRQGFVWFGVETGVNIIDPNSPKPIIELTDEVSDRYDAEAVLREHGPMDLVHRKYEDQ